MNEIGYFFAVEAVFQNEQHWDEVIFLGDALQFGPRPDEVLTRLRKSDALCRLHPADSRGHPIPLLPKSFISSSTLACMASRA